MTLQIAFGKAVKLLRNKGGWTQDLLAVSAEVDRTYISLIERGEVNPTIRVIFSISAALNVQPEELIILTKEFMQGVRSEK